jgi:hypothetical protein
MRSGKLRTVGAQRARAWRRPGRRRGEFVRGAYCRLRVGPAARHADLGYGCYQARTDTDRKLRKHIR